MVVHSDKFINDSVIAFIKRSDNLSISAVAKASSGCADFVNDFKTYDSNDITSNDDSCVFCSWIPNINDKENWLSLSLPSHKTIHKIVVYKNPVYQCRLNNVSIIADTGEKYCFDEFGNDSYVKTMEVNISSKCREVVFHIDTPDGKNIGICEIEIFENRDYEIDILQNMLVDCSKKEGVRLISAKYYYRIIFAVFRFYKKHTPSIYDYM